MRRTCGEAAFTDGSRAPSAGSSSGAGSFVAVLIAASSALAATVSSLELDMLRFMSIAM
jgi:hypothetical protein